MSTRRLDVTLASATLIDPSVAYWLIEAAQKPDEVEIRLMDESDEGFVLELRYANCEAHAGLVYCDKKWEAIHTGAALGNSPGAIKQRSVAEMAQACMCARRRQVYARRCINSVNFLLFTVLPLAAILGTLSLIGYLIRA